MSSPEPDTESASKPDAGDAAGIGSDVSSDNFSARSPHGSTFNVHEHYTRFRICESSDLADLNHSPMSRNLSQDIVVRFRLSTLSPIPSMRQSNELLILNKESLDFAHKDFSTVSDIASLHSTSNKRSQSNTIEPSAKSNARMIGTDHRLYGGGTMTNAFTRSGDDMNGNDLDSTYSRTLDSSTDTGGIFAVTLTTKESGGHGSEIGMRNNSANTFQESDTSRTKAHYFGTAPSVDHVLITEKPFRVPKNGTKSSSSKTEGSASALAIENKTNENIDVENCSRLLDSEAEKDILQFRSRDIGRRVDLLTTAFGKVHDVKDTKDDDLRLDNDDKESIDSVALNDDEGDRIQYDLTSQPEDDRNNQGSDSNTGIHDEPDTEMPSEINPYLGKRVVVIAGKHKGSFGKIIAIASRGWWTLDNPDLMGQKVHSKVCELLDTVHESQLHKYYAGIGTKMRRTPSVMLRQKKRKGEDDLSLMDEDEDCQEDNNEDEDDEIVSCPLVQVEQKQRRRRAPNKMRSLPRVNHAFGNGHNDSTKATNTIQRRTRSRRAAASNVYCKLDEDFLSRSTVSNVHDTDVGTGYELVPVATEVYGSQRSASQHSISQPLKNRPDSRHRDAHSYGTPFTESRNHSTGMRTISFPTLEADRFQPPGSFSHGKKRSTTFQAHPPVILNAEDDTALPDALCYLPPDFKIDIFNRKTGRVLSGPDAVRVKDLPDILRKHAEYEPVVPPHSMTERSLFREGSRQSSRMGRSSARVRVNATVIPQSKIRGSAAEGKAVIVTGGPYRGLTGKIEACMPGGWYLVANLLEDDELELDVVIKSCNLDLIPEHDAIESRNCKSTLSSCPNGGMASSREQKLDLGRSWSISMRSTQLRTAALTEEMSNIEMAIASLELANETKGNHSLSLKTTPECGCQVVKDSLPTILTTVDKQHAKHEVDNSVDPQQIDPTHGLQLYQLRRQLKILKASLAKIRHNLHIEETTAYMLGADKTLET